MSFPSIDREEWKLPSLDEHMVRVPLPYKSNFKNRIKCAEERYVNYRSHMYDLAFGITYYKVQGQTIKKIILDLNKRPGSLKQLDFYAFYVGMTRVELAENIRILPCQNDDNFKHLLRLKPQQKLKKWLGKIKQCM